MARVLVTGGSGFLGINLSRYLDGKGYKLNVIDLERFDYPDMKDRIKFFHGDIRDRKLLRESMKGCDFVVHCAVALPLYKPKEIFSTNVRGTRMVLDTAVDLKVKRVVHISSTAVYGIPDHHPIFEDDLVKGVGPYGESKVRAELACVEFREKGLCVPILRPKSFLGPERLGVFAIYYDWIARNKNIPIIGNGRNRYQLLDVEDVCESIRLCMTRPEKKANDTFNIGAKIFTTMKEDFGAVLEFRGAGKKVVPIPAKPLIFVLRILEALHLSPLYKWVYETAPEDSFVSIEKAEDVLGFTPKYSNKDALLRNYKWYLKNRKRLSKSSGVSHRVPWKQGILRFVSWFF